jgi:hypothetical protein
VKVRRHRELLLGFGAWCAACLVFTFSAFAQPSTNAVLVELRGTWPEPLAREVHADLDASLRERGVAVLDAKQPGTGARATLRIYPPTNEDLDVRVAIIDSAQLVLAERHLKLMQEHPDTWSVAIAATADELLAATWSLPERAAQGPAPADAPSEGAPLKTGQATLPQTAPQRESAKGSGVLVKETGRADTPKMELGVAASGEHYTWGGTTYGGDVFSDVPAATSSSFSFAGVVRRIASEVSRDGQVTGTLAGANVLFVQQLIGNRWTAFDVVSGVHTGFVWFSAEPNDEARALATTAALLSLRLGARWSVFTSQRTRIGLLVTSGVPLVRAVAEDSTGGVVRLGGLEFGARLEVGWR